MVSKRSFLGITIMIAILFFMFMFSEVTKSSDLSYNRNNYANVTPIVHRESIENDNALKIAFCGENTELYDSVKEWCFYTGKNFVGEMKESQEDNQLIVVDSSSLDRTRIEFIRSAAERGVVIVFCGFPEKSMISANSSLRTLMGISKIMDQNAVTTGAYLYSGFLIGGDAVYQANRDKELQYQDLQLTYPWYTLGKGTKTYMSGLFETDGRVSDDSPALIWRAISPSSTAFVIHEDFITGLTLPGILEACIYEASDFSLYPVVNAEMYSVADFAILSEENSAKIDEVYSRSTQSLVKEIVWPRIMSYAKRDDIKMTFFFNTGLDSLAENKYTGDLSFYLREIREVSAEAGISVDSNYENIYRKLADDAAFYKQNAENYKFSGMYLEELGDNFIEALKESRINTNYLVTRNANMPGVIQNKNNITVLGVTQDADRYTYKGNFLQKCMDTYLGYSNVLIEMDRVVWPQSMADEWQIYSEVISGNLSDYWSKFNIFDQVTISEAGKRAAEYLEFSAKTMRVDNTITIVPNGEGYMLLRTHGEEISKINNAKAKKLETDVYLIEIDDAKETVEIILEVR